MLTVTSRNPIHSALWFASVVLSTAGLFLLAGAPVPGGGHGDRLRRGDHRHVPVRDHAGADGRKGRLRPSRPVAVSARRSTCYMLLWCLIYSLSAIRPNRRTGSKSPRLEQSLSGETPCHRRPRQIYRVTDIPWSATGPSTMSRSLATDRPADRAISFTPTARQAQRRRARRIALYRPSGHRRDRRRLVVRRPDRRRLDHQSPKPPVRPTDTRGTADRSSPRPRSTDQ